MKYLTKFLIVVILLIKGDLLFAQQSGILTYKLTIDDRAKHKARVENYVTYFKSGRSIEFFVPKMITNSTTIIDEGNIVDVKSYSTMSKRKYFLLKDYVAKKQLLANSIDLKYYLIDDTLANFKWNITTETQQLLKYNCTKATTEFRGRTYEAWFTEDVPVANGPWKFGGLPGLIVNIKDVENQYTFELLGADFESNFDTNIISIPDVYKNEETIAHAKFIDLYARKVKDLEAESKASYFSKGNVSGFTRVTIAPLIEKF